MTAVPDGRRFVYVEPVWFIKPDKSIPKSPTMEVEVTFRPMYEFGNQYTNPITNPASETRAIMRKMVPWSVFDIGDRHRGDQAENGAGAEHQARQQNLKKHQH